MHSKLFILFFIWLTVSSSLGFHDSFRGFLSSSNAKSSWAHPKRSYQRIISRKPVFIIRSEKKRWDPKEAASTSILKSLTANNTTAWAPWMTTHGETPPMTMTTPLTTTWLISKTADWGEVTYRLRQLLEAAEIPWNSLTSAGPGVPKCPSLWCPPSWRQPTTAAKFQWGFMNWRKLRIPSTANRSTWTAKPTKEKWTSPPPRSWENNPRAATKATRPEAQETSSNSPKVKFHQLAKRN